MGVAVIHEAERASRLLKPMRLRMLEMLAEPGSASGLARRLNMPRQKVNYHLRELEKEGFVELVEERRAGNCVERIVRATSRYFLVNPDALGGLSVDPAEVQDHFSASYLIAVAARAIRDLAVLRSKADATKKRLATLALQSEIRFASAVEQNAFAEELANTLAKLIAKYHDEKARGGRRFKLFAGAYPALPKIETHPGKTDNER
jgi:DNA-binding transcriptional ArsR family regulator